MMKRDIFSKFLQRTVKIDQLSLWKLFRDMVTRASVPETSKLFLKQSKLIKHFEATFEKLDIKISKLN